MRDLSGLRRQQKLRSGLSVGKMFIPIFPAALFTLLSLALVVSAQTRTRGNDAPTASSSEVTIAQNGDRASDSPLSKPLQLIKQARGVMQRVKNYSCYLVVQERIKGKLQPQQMMEMKMRSEPFSVYFRWLAPRQNVGQETCYVQGKNRNQMRVRSKGLLGAVGFVSISPRDPRVFQHSRHTITEAGLGNLVNRLATAWEQEKRLNKTKVRLAEYEYNKRRCLRVETIHPERVNGGCENFRTVVYFDKQFHLPIRVELYDWPRQGGSPGGDLLECFSYLNLRFNIALPDATFNK